MRRRGPAALAALLVVVGGIEASHVAQTGGSDNPACLVLTSNSSCLKVNGCSWCSSEAQPPSTSSMACMSWRQCQGPPSNCALRHDEASCGAPGMSGEGGVTRWASGVKSGEGSAAGAADPEACAWCKVEQRCVSVSPDSEQCVGCDGHFDSGVIADACGKCGGGCVDSFMDFKNPFCPCLGCDNVAYSNQTLDSCGVCGGTNTTCFPFQSLTKQERVGISLALCGNVLISVSLNTQKYAHNMNELNSGGALPYMQLPMWWLGMTLMTLGETGNFLAYAYAPATLVAPLGAVTVISNCILAHYVLKEDINSRNVWGVVLAIVGAVFIVTYAPSSDQQLTMDLLEQYMTGRLFVAYMFCLIAVITSLFLTRESHQKKYVVIYVLICSMTGSITVMCVKGVSTALILTFQGHNQFIYFVPWMLLVTTIGTILIQMRYLNLAMINFGASEVVPVYYVLFTFWSILGGMVLYKEYHQNCPDATPHCNHTLWFLLGCAITFSGVYLITFASKVPSDGYGRRSSSMGGEPGEAHETERLMGAAGSSMDESDEERGNLGGASEERDINAGSSLGDTQLQSLGGSLDKTSGGYMPSEL